METIINKLKIKKQFLLADNAKYNDRVRLNRTLFYSTMRNTARNNCKIRAIDLAIEIVREGVRNVDIDLYATDIIHPRRSDRDQWLKVAMFGTCSEKQPLLIFLIETYLPICKKQILTLIN